MKSNSEVQPVGSLMAQFRARREAQERLQQDNPSEYARQRAERQAAFEAEQKRIHDEARERVEASLPDRLALLGVPELAIRALQKPDETPAMKRARRWWESEATERPFFVMLGAVGAGKTVAAVWCLSRHLAAGRDAATPGGGRPIPRAVFLRASAFARMSAYDAKDREWLENDLHRTSLLVLDDMGAEYLTPSAMTLFDEMLDVRYGNMRRTILTSNLAAQPPQPPNPPIPNAPPTFRERYGQRLWDRLAQVGVMHDAGADSLRKKPQPKQNRGAA